ncbi:hypothetical protein V6N12_056580 [Hibiscus sabdariffa]|uniref:YbaB/EbfC family nucleoid-associated protein n=1 Tax=Hibiscus sabdariffa TaxID=183260 RepID=A0ABR2CTE2_9ROSI
MEEQKQSMEVLQKMMQDVVRQLTVLTAQGGQTSKVGLEPEGPNEVFLNRGKMKVKEESEDAFPFPPKPAYMELPLFTGKDPEE